jgi:hypothetical protein
VRDYWTRRGHDTDEIAEVMTTLFFAGFTRTRD